MKGTVYLFHFDRPVGNLTNPRAQASHYIGYATSGNLATRFWQHVHGHGSPLVRAAVKAGITVRITRIWSGDGKLERELKNRKNAPQLCPLCIGEQIQEALRGWTWQSASD